jgi:hypothetical protein
MDLQLYRYLAATVRIYCISRGRPVVRMARPTESDTIEKCWTDLAVSTMRVML